MMMWNAFSPALRDKIAKQQKSLRSVEIDTGLSHARVHDTFNGKPAGTEVYLTLCKWLNVHPGTFWSGDVRDNIKPQESKQ